MLRFYTDNPPSDDWHEDIPNFPKIPKPRPDSDDEFWSAVEEDLDVTDHHTDDSDRWPFPDDDSQTSHDEQEALDEDMTDEAEFTDTGDLQEFPEE